MATVYKFLQDPQDFYDELQVIADTAEFIRRKKFLAALMIQKIARGYLIRKHVAWLSYNAAIIQRAFKCHQARKAFRAALKLAVKNKHRKYYDTAATRIQALWRGHKSRRNQFCYYTYRRWLANVTERGQRMAAKAAEFGVRSRADDLQILEEEARQWLAYVVFKLHHLLRTYTCAGIYSEPATHELSEFEKLLKAIHYKDYMKRLKHKYDEFVKKHKPKFANKRLFPIIGEGGDYWYMSLPEMYDLTRKIPQKRNTRHIGAHHGPVHAKPFLWKKVPVPTEAEYRGPYKPSKTMSQSALTPAPPAPTPLPATPGGDAPQPQKDPRFHLYVKYYKPKPDLFDYVDFQINALLNRKCSIQNVTEDEKS